MEGDARLAEIEDELAVLRGQVARCEARITELVAEVQASEALGATGCRSVESWLAWRAGLSRGRARSLTTVASRRSDLPRIAAAVDAGEVTVDQAAVLAARLPADPGVDAHFAELAPAMTVTQLKVAVRAAVPPAEPPDPEPPERRVVFGHDDAGGWRARITADAVSGAQIEAGLRAHLDALWQVHRAEREAAPADAAPPVPTWFDALERMVDRSLEREVTDRPHSQRTKVVVHVDAEADVATLHLGPALAAAERAMATCDGTVQTVLERHGTPVSVGRERRIVPSRTRMLVEQRDGGCIVPWCRCTVGLHCHHVDHWADGGPTDVDNLAMLCGPHHRDVHAGRVQLRRRPDGRIEVLDHRGDPVGRRARPPDESWPDDPAPVYEAPTGERMDWSWYDPPTFTLAD